MISLKWSDQVVFLEEDFKCSVETYQSFGQRCEIDFENRVIKIRGVFQEASGPYSAPITISLDQITNPKTNKNLTPFVIETFDDSQEEFPVDRLEFAPGTPCAFPCRRCSTDKDYCYSCWADDDLRFLMTTETYSTCKEKCDDGWTTNGNVNKVCQKCDASCETCLDNGEEGDLRECTKCAEGYNFRIGRQCLEQCPIGYFTDGARCKPCSSNCLSCEGSADFCTACNGASTFNYLHENKCYENCPPGMGSLAGKCFDCEYPCTECSTGPQICTECSQEKGLAFLYGPTCITECPPGFNVNEAEKTCDGCGAGCVRCDKDDNRICLECQGDFLMHNGKCVSDCPSGYLSDYNASYCYSVASLDVDLIPFPCLIIATVLFFLSYVGYKQKRKHLMIPNWLVLMGLLVHGCLLSQLILNFKYGTFFYGIFLIAAYACFVITNIVFIVMHYKKVATNDRLYSSWRNRPHNIWARRMMNVLAFIGNWYSYKLSYAAFYGIKLTPAKFSNPRNFRQLMKVFLWVNIGTIYVPMIGINFIGLVDMPWGTQLYIQMIENILIFIIMIWAGLWEQKKMETAYLPDPLKKSGKMKMNVMSALDDDALMPELSKTKEQLLGAHEFNKLFTERKFDELIDMFGDRRCKSFYDLNRDCTEDPRMVKTWPASPGAVAILPIEPLPDPYPNNCYARGLNDEQWFQMKFLSKGKTSKANQSDAYDADYNLRKDAHLVGHQRDLAEVTRSTERKKVRGRKNRYFRQIDNEDHEAGVLLDDDDEGNRENMKARNELLDAQTSLEARRLKENKKLIQEETRQKAMMLTEENLRLKKLLEEQRLIDAKDQQEFQNRILEEEKRRQDVLHNIERARQQREAKKQAINSNLQSEKEARLAEIEQMKQQHLANNSKMTEEQRLAAEAQFNAEKARLESEFNEKMLKSQREAAPSESANSPAKFGSQTQLEPVKNIRLKPQGVASVPAEASTPPEPSAIVQQTPASAKKSVGSSRASASPDVTAHRISMMQTADEASALDASFVMDNEFEKREFNEIDIVGSLDRDEKGNIIVPVDENTGSKRSFDNQGRPINHFGYLIDSESGAIVNAHTGGQVFAFADLDERGNIPMPYALEKFNFNPFDLQGTFFYDDVEDPLSFQKNQRSGSYIDELGRTVNLQGFLIDKAGNVLDKDGLKRFDWRQFCQFGGLIPKLYNYYGKTFELQEVMGVFDRNEKGGITLLLGKDERGKDVYVDKAGFMVNSKGYVVTRDGHICTREGKVLFLKSTLKNGEFPKIFPFTRFNINRVLGDIEMDPGGQPILTKNELGQLTDRQGRLVNQKGFLCDKHGNVVDCRGKLVFEKALLEHNGDIPEIFRSNILRSDSQSSLSRFMSEIDRDQRFDESAMMKQGSVPPRHAAASDTSFESMMEDSPSKYDKQNMRFSHSNPDAYGYGANPPKSARWAGTMPDNIMEEMSEYEAGYEPHQRKRKRVKGKNFVVEQVTGRDIQMASAYGGVAKPRIRKTVPRFSTVARIDRTGLQTSQGGMRPANPRMQNLTSQVQPFEAQEAQTTIQQKRMASSKPGATDNAGATTRAELTTNRTGNTFDVSKNGAGGFRPGASTNWREQASASNADDEEGASTVHNLRNKRSAAQAKRKKKGAQKKPDGASTTPNALQMPKYDRGFEEEFEKVYKKDIDKFIDGSDFEVESLAGFSEISKGTFKSAVQNNPRMKGLEKVYLQRLEFQQLGQKAKKYRRKPVVKREFLDRFCDDPRYISKGEKLKFEIGNTTFTGSSGKKKPPTNYNEMNAQRSQSSLHGQEAGLVQTTSPLRPAHTPENFKLALQGQDSAHSNQYQNQQRQLSRQNLR